jgi:outer membrane protein
MRSMFRATIVALGFTGMACAAQAQGQPFKIAFVNTTALMEAAPGRAAADSALQKLGDSFKVQIQKMQDSIQTLYTNYTKKEATLTTAQKDAQQKAIQGLETDLQAKNLQLQQQFSQKQQEFYAPIQEAVKKVIEDIRVEDGYAIILANDPGGASAIVAADKNLDITERMLARLRTIKATNATKTAPAPNGPAGVTRPPARPPAE